MSIPNMPDLILLTQQITSLKSDVEGVKDRVVDLEEGGGGGGGGSAYPDNITIASSPGTVALTAEDQGGVTATVSGVTFNLPEEAEDGTTFKFASIAADMAINAGAAFIINFLSSTTVIPAGAAFALQAINVDLGGGLALYWSVADHCQISFGAWNDEAYYLPGMKVTKGGRTFMSIHTGSHINCDPEIQTAYWYKIPENHDDSISDSIAEGNITFGADVAPSGFSGSAVNFKTMGVISLLQVDADYRKPGTDVNQVVIALGDFADANPSVSILPSQNSSGTACVNGTSVVCRYTASTRSITIDLPISGIVGTEIHAKLVF